ncbi:Chaperone DnaJ-domain superfamily protein [Rhynchospora pubera]|uniref:Chaperone DnaJ-domain superfamily protein n=1 Tax=Rhynchospora pubera TaxID=906938 RepID=A0AAV8CC02_9POAL|nr:Chaperone DnaJ-domain superfamily protein [Rhynchospora pubera]
MANASGGGGRAEAERWLEISGRLLAARDLVGSKRFAERAMEADPLLEGVDFVLAVADVLLASQRRIGPHHVDWYAVLGVDPNADEPTIRRQHHRLAMLLRPEVNSHAGAEAASHLVADALSFLTDPSKKTLIDNEIRKQSAKSNTSPTRAKTNSATPKTPAPAASTPKTPATHASASVPTSAPASAATAVAATSINVSSSSAFWTACPFCCHLHQYKRTYKDRSLLCPNSNCRRPFHASELPVPPPVVPGTDTYYSAWGFFPMGFPKPSELDENWKPFHPVFPWNPNQVQAEPNGHAETLAGSGAASASAAGGKKTTARKKVGRPRKNPLQSELTAGAGSSGGNAEQIRGININEEAKGPDGGGQATGGDIDETNFQMEVDPTDELLGNLQNIPFLREDGVPGRML